MKICDMFGQEKPVISFEIFPPKPDLPLESVYETLEQLKSLNPAFISVTYGAGGSSSSRSIEIVDKVKNYYGMETLAHLTCVGSTVENIDTLLDRLQELGIENILAMRGDPPVGQTTFVQTANGFRYASDLIKHIKQRRYFCLAAAAYPEGHIECRDIRQDITYLKLKVDQGVDLLITQLFFDNDFFYAFRDRMARYGIECPVSAGIMPVLNEAQVKRITTLCGSSIPAALLRIMDKYGANPADMEKAGIEFASQQIRDLLDNNADGIHLYTMNKPKQARAIMQNIGQLG